MSQEPTHRCWWLHSKQGGFVRVTFYCPACRTYEIATRFWVVVICPIIKCLTVLEFSFILFDLCLFITIFNFILNYVLIVIFWIFTYHKIWILLIIYCFIWTYWIIFFNMFGSVLECCELTGVSLLWTRMALANKAKIGLVFLKKIRDLSRSLIWSYYNHKSKGLYWSIRYKRNRLC